MISPSNFHPWPETNEISKLLVYFDFVYLECPACLTAPCLDFKGRHIHGLPQLNPALGTFVECFTSIEEPYGPRPRTPSLVRLQVCVIRTQRINNVLLWTNLMLVVSR